MASADKKAGWQNSVSQKKTEKISSIKKYPILWKLGISILTVALIVYGITVYWSIEPAEFDVVEFSLKRADKTNAEKLATGYVFANTLAHISETLLEKNGGFLSNDIFPGGIIDNMPAWEFGALVMLRDGASALRNHFARSQSQSKENAQLSQAEPFFYYNHTSWALPSTEDEYKKGTDNLLLYLRDLNNPDAHNAHFFSRADNLDQYLQVILKRLGDYSYRLSASSVSKQSYDLASNKVSVTKTPWMEVDDVFWEARGATWALLHLFKSIEADFDTTLRGKGAKATLRQIIHELEDAQVAILSPVILNGDGFGLFANYSLTMANHIARANAATLDLRELMLRG